MFDIGFLELALIGVVALLVLGPERLPTAARTAGLWVGRARKMVGELTREVDRQLKTEEIRERLSKEGDELGLEKIQKTVDDALLEAGKFKHMVDKPVDTVIKEDRPAESSASSTTDTSATPPLIDTATKPSDPAVAPDSKAAASDHNSPQKS